MSKNITKFEYYNSDRDVKKKNPLITVDDFITDFIANRNQVVTDYTHLNIYNEKVKGQVDMKAYVTQMMSQYGRNQLLTYPLYRALRRYAFSKHGEDMILRHMSMQGFYLDVTINYLRLPTDYTLDDLVEYVVNNSMIIRSIMEGAFPHGGLAYRAYSFLYQRVARSEKYAHLIAAVTGHQSGRGGNMRRQ